MIHLAGAVRARLTLIVGAIVSAAVLFATAVGRPGGGYSTRCVAKLP